ncbi:MAG: tRNA 2-selenouridine(34) synthase MnmH [Rikenellaceae bacterium]
MQNIKEIALPEFKPSSKVETLDVDAFLGREDSVILDIRSEGEYATGHIENAISFPLFNNEERAQVGTTYKRRGKSKAVELGLEIVGPKLHQFVKDAKALGCTKNFHLYCWRGGMRSGSMAWLLSTAGLRVSLLKGGYKAYRQSFVDCVAKDWKFITILGSTGTGKTELLRALESKGEQMLDLEGLANHKGSVFGSFGLGAQPSTEEFINRIHQKLREFDSSKRVWVEGESMMIGSCYIPQQLYDKLLVSPYYLTNMPRQERIERLSEEYGSFDLELVEMAFTKITKRMGGNNVKDALDAFRGGDVARAVSIALDYYDKGYAMASEKRVGQNLGEIVLQSHNHDEVAVTLIENCIL